MPADTTTVANKSLSWNTAGGPVTPTATSAEIRGGRTHAGTQLLLPRAGEETQSTGAESDFVPATGRRHPPSRRRLRRRRRPVPNVAIEGRREDVGIPKSREHAPLLLQPGARRSQGSGSRVLVVDAGEVLAERGPLALDLARAGEKPPGRRAWQVAAPCLPRG